MTQGLFANIASAFRQPSTPFSSQEENMGTNASQASDADSDSSQNLASSSKFQQVSVQELAAQRASIRHLQQRILATQILISQFSTDIHTQEILQSILQETLVLTHAGKFPSFDAALAHLQTNLRPEIAAVFQSFTQSEAGRRTLNFIRQSEGRMSPSSLRILVEAARSLTPPSRYLGRTLMLGVFVNEFIHGNKIHSALFQTELLSLGRDFLYETQSTLSVWGNRFEYVSTHGLSDNYNHWSESLFSPSPEEQALQNQTEQAETLMQIVKVASPQIADQAMQGDLGQQVGFREIENALGRASIFFASSPGDQISMMSNYAASVASGYLSAVLSRTRFSGYALALAAVGGGLNGAVQGGIGLAHQMGNMTSEQVQRNAVPLAWQFFKGILIGTASGMGEYGVGRILHPLPVSNPLLKMGIGILGFGTGDVGAEVLATNVLTWVGVSLGLEQEQILQASGICGFVANGVDELGGGVTNHFNVVNLMNIGAVGAAIPLSPQTRIHEESEKSSDSPLLNNSHSKFTVSSQTVEASSSSTRSLHSTSSIQATVARNEDDEAQVNKKSSRNQSNSSFVHSLNNYGIFQNILTGFSNIFQNIGSFFQDLAFSQAFLFMGIGGGSFGAPGRTPLRARLKTQVSKEEIESTASPSILSGTKENPFPIQIDIPITEKMEEKDIEAVVRAIIEQDTEYYPDANGALLSTSPNRLGDRRYLVGGKVFPLQTLAGKVRLARGYKTVDTKGLSNKTVVNEWKEKIFNRPKISKANLILTGEFKDSKDWGEFDIDELVRKIVLQDIEFYPNGNAALISTNANYFQKRRYRVGNEDINLVNLAARVRKLRGYKKEDIESLPNTTIINEWKERVFNLSKIPRSALVLEGDFKFEDPHRWSEAEINEIVRAIVKQDIELYPDGTVTLMSTAAKYFVSRRYRIDEHDFTLQTLVGRVRVTRGYLTNDLDKLANASLINQWKEQLFGYQTPSIANLVLEGDFKFEDPKSWSETEIKEVVRAIVQQDRELYPDGSPDLMCVNLKYFINRQYRVIDEDLSLNTLAGRFRKSRGFGTGNTKSLSNSSIVEEWKEKIFNSPTISKADLVLEGDFTVKDPKNWSENEINAVVWAIVQQDKELYSNGNAAPMSTSDKYFSKRIYRIGNEDINLATLAGKLRRLRGFLGKEKDNLPYSTIIAEWKKNIFKIINFSEISSSNLEDYSNKNNLNEIINLFSSDTLLLREMLLLLKPEVFLHNDVDQFIQAYVGLQVAREKTAKITREEVNTWELRKRYLAALAEALGTGIKLDVSEESFQHQLDLFIRLSRTSYQENPKQFVLQLQESITRSEHPFMRRLQEETLRYFEADEALELVNMKSKASSYQKEGARFLTTHNLAILGDEAGMGKSYQAIAAVEKLALKRVLWVTTASNKENIKREITGHSHVTEKDIRVVISGDPKKRTEQVQALNGERYRITNYETLVALQKNDPVGYAKLTEGLDVIIVDEAQMTDNADTLRQSAIAGISTPRKWLLTATPYQNKPEKFWTLLNYLDGKRYPDFSAFKNLYCDSSRGLELLHSELRRYMLRRTKRHTLLNFRDPLEISFEEQLQNDALRLPKFERLDPKVWGHYDLSPEQSDLIAWMVADYRGWAEAFNENLPLGAEPIDLNNINPLEKFETIHKVIYSPELFGITTPNPLYEKLDARVREKIERGEKVILWAWNTEVLDQLQKRYGPQAVRIDGTVTGNARERAILDFQNNPNAKILIANFVSGGVGLTLTAATTAIDVQLPLQYSLMYQMEGRHHRLIGLKNIQHAKYKVGMEYLVPQYPAEFLARLTDEKLAKLLKSGTLVEQSFARLIGAEVLYRLVMEGYGDPEKLDAYFKQGLVKNLGLTGSEKIDYTGHLKSRVRQEAEVVQALLPLWNMFSGSEEAQDQVLRLMDAYLHYPEQAKALGEVFEQAGKSYPEDLKIILSLFEFKNKHIREQLLKRLPQLLIGLYAKGESLQSVANGLKMNRLNPANLIALMYVKAGLGSETVIAIARRIAQQKDDPRRRYLEEHYVTAIFGLMGGEDTQALLEKMQPLLNSAKLENAVHVLYRLGLMARCKKVKAISELSLGEGFDVFHKQFEMIFYNVLGEYFAVTPEEVQAQVAGNENWFGSADPLLALMLGWQEYDNKEAVGKFQDAMMHVFEGKQKEWRLNNGAIEFLEEEPEGEAYWEKIAENHRTEIPNLVIESADTQTVQQASYANLREEVEQHQKAVEGVWVKNEIQAWRKLSRRIQDQRIAEVRESLRIEVAKLKEANTSEQKMDCLLRMKPVKELLSWMQLELAMESNRREDALRELNQKEKRYREAGYDKVADHFLELIQQLEQEILSRRVFKDLTIEDTDDAALFIRMGALHPELLNCFNPNANPVFTQNVVAALGSKNMRLVVVREQGKIIAVAMMKVKQSEEGEPVLFLEKGLYRKGYDFRKEMLSHLLKKAASLPIATKVATQIMGKSNDEDPFLIGTGAFTKSVYEEAVFGLRASNNVRHRGRWVTNLSLQASDQEGANPSSAAAGLSAHSAVRDGKQQTLFSLESKSPVLGIGTSNKPIQKYIAELISNEVTCVVDVRQNPHSQYYPQFNRKNLEASLTQAGILYVFMGDTLGNPKDALGERSLQNFEQEHRQSQAYKQGLSLLIELIRKNSGKVALTCSEGKEQECHRKFILRDVQQMLELEEESTSESK